MVGIIVTGHGGFAAGMEKNVKMLATCGDGFYGRDDAGGAE